MIVAAEDLGDCISIFTFLCLMFSLSVSYASSQMMNVAIHVKRFVRHTEEKVGQ